LAHSEDFATLCGIVVTEEALLALYHGVIVALSDSQEAPVNSLNNRR
jgi:hypothetical protein